MKECPFFKQIVDELKTNDEFFTELVDKSEFFDYVEYIDNCQSTYDAENRIIHFSDFIQANGRKKNVQPIFYKSNMTNSINNRDKFTDNISKIKEETAELQVNYDFNIKD